jgi:exopolyphosphatase/guanosine-5'-triphosphate,3'-diphosphate pyrophosphatase
MPEPFELTAEQIQALELVNNLAQTCTHEFDHAKHVTYLALRLFDELLHLHQLGAEQRFWLQCAGLLNDIGWVEGWKEHHKASLQIILSTPLLPFSGKERLIIGSIARYHRRALPDLKHDHYKALEPDEREIVNKLAALLRLADGLDSTHLRRVRDIK